MTRAGWAPAAAAVTGLLVAVPAGVDAGWQGVLSALLGTALVLGFLGSGIVPLLLVRGMAGSAALGLGVLLLNYTFRLAVAVVALTLVSRSGVLEPRWTGFAVIAGALAWTAGQGVAVLGPGADHGPGPDPDPDRHDQAGHGPAGPAG